MGGFPTRERVLVEIKTHSSNIVKRQHLPKTSPVIVSTMGSTEEEVTVYLSSLGSRDLYPDNVPGCFTNEIIPISLNPNRNYELALHGLFIPREVYTLHKEDDETAVEVYTQTLIHGGNDNETSATTKPHLRYTLNPPRNITSKEISAIVEELNTYWLAVLKGVFGATNYNLYFNEERGVVSYTKNYVCYHKRSVDGCDSVNYCRISLLFKPRLAAILGFLPNHHYDIFVTEESRHYDLLEINAPFPPDPHADVDYLHLYCDVIQPTRFAGQMANILATLPYGGSNNYYSVQRPIYKKLCKNNIDSITILTTDQYGRKIYFEESRSATIVIHIRSSVF